MISRRVQIALLLLVVIIVGMGYYALKLKERAEAAEQKISARPLPAPAAQKQQINAVVANDADISVAERKLEAPTDGTAEDRARNALRALTAFYSGKDSPHPLASGADVNVVFLVDGDTAIIDLNEAFANGHPSGIETEQLTIVSYVRTLAEQLPNVKRVKFLVNGKERDTLAGHADLRAFYDVALVDDAAKELKR